MDDNQAQEREEMVQTTLSARDISAPAVLAAMREVPRHLFVPQEVAAHAYNDSPLPIGHQQTISQPYIVAFMAQMALLEPTHRVLEIGAGSGYGAAVLSRLVAEVYTIELQPALAESAAARIANLGYDNVQVRCGDGSQGWPEAAPFDAIIVTAAPPRTPFRVLQQLKQGGRAVIPIGIQGQQFLYTIEHLPTGWLTQQVLPVRFVPMLGEIQGAPSQETSYPPEGWA